MSIVVAKKFKDRIEIGGDSQTTSGYMKLKDIKNRGHTKIFEFMDGYIGSVGSVYGNFMMNQFIRTHVVDSVSTNAVFDFYVKFIEYCDGRDKVKTEGILSTNSYLMVLDNKIFRLSVGFVEEMPKYYCIGSGRDYAMGVLYATEARTIKPALEAACEFDLFCHEPIQIETVWFDKNKKT